MSVITFANAKGGAGKTTSALLLGTTLSQNPKLNITIIDADPQKWISKWAMQDGKPANIEVINQITAENIYDEIEAAHEHAHFIIIDTEGTANELVGFAALASDLVIIPTQGSEMDAEGAVKTAKLVNRHAKAAKRVIPFSVLFTRTNAAIRTRSLSHISKELIENGIDVLDTTLHERAAFRELFAYGGIVNELPAQNVSNIDKAIINAESFTQEVIEKLKAPVAHNNAVGGA